MFETHKMQIRWIAGAIFVLVCALFAVDFAAGERPDLFASPNQEAAARQASTQFAEKNGLQAAGQADTKLETDYAAEHLALLALCEKYGISLTEQEERDCDNYYETVMPMMEADENPEALNAFKQIVRDSGLSLEEYEKVSEANMKYTILREKLTKNIYADDTTAYESAIADCIRENGF